MLKTYACYNTDDEIRKQSSSGGIFTLLAELILNENGVVYGVAMSADCYSAEFVAATDKKGLEKLRGSKYLQAKMGNTYKQVKANLVEGKKVLFSGTGCQINGLKKFLGKEYSNLYCVDVICHGAPAPALWKSYLKNQEKTHGEKVRSVNFRCKDIGWKDYGIKENDIYTSKNENAYIQMFLGDYCLRPSCYNCVAKTVKLSDITIGDFWGIDKIAPEMNDEKGTSLVIVRSEKGMEFFERIEKNIEKKEVSYEEGVKYNPVEHQSVLRPDLRDDFWTDMKAMPFDKLKRKYASPMTTSIKAKIKRKIKKIYLKIKYGE